MSGNDTGTGIGIGTWAIFVVGAIIVLLVGINIGGEVTGTGYR